MRKYLNKLTALAVLGILALSFAQTNPVRSSLYPENWTPNHPATADGRFLHDFSYAGYMMGNVDIPNRTGPIINVTHAPYNANNTGTADACAAIQAAINAAQNTTTYPNGAVVYLPAGTYRVNPGVIRITGDNIVLRGDGVGRTFIRCYRERMRGETVIQVGRGGNWGAVDGGVQSNITANVANRATTVNVANASGFAVGNWIILRVDRTQAWIDEHNMGGFWSTAHNGIGQAPAFFRRITAINGNTITFDIPVRYPLNVRDNARVYRVGGRTQHSGIEGFSIGNKSNPITSGWGEEDYNTAGRGAEAVHASFLVRFNGAVNCWAKDIHSYAAGNPHDTRLGYVPHMTSNGFGIGQSARITIDNCNFSYPQYRGGGGNGYGWDISASDILITNSVSTATRHAYAFKHAHTSGVVVHNFRSNNNTLASDFHMYLSMSNLIDNQTVNSDFIESVVRPYGGTAGNRHGHSSTQTVIWNTNGIAGRGNRSVDSRQHGWGYVIGTRGNETRVQTTPVRWNTAYGQAITDPEDHREHIGNGQNLVPQSLYRDQLARRLGSGIITRDSTPIAIPAVFNSTRYVGKSSEVADNGNYVGNLVNNSWVDYVIDVPAAGNYTVVLNVARGNDAARTISVRTGTTGANAAERANISIPAGTDWFAFFPVVRANINFPTAGRQILRLQANGSVNIEDITIGTPIALPGNIRKPVSSRSLTQNSR